MGTPNARFIVIQHKDKHWNGDQVFYFDREEQVKDLMMKITDSQDISLNEEDMIEFMFSFADLVSHIIVFYKGSKLHGPPLLRIFEGGVLPEKYRPYNAGASLESGPLSLYN